MLNVRVDRGTDAGRRPPFNGTPEPWECGCVMVMKGRSVGFTTAMLEGALPKVNPGYLAACLDCGERRP